MRVLGISFDYHDSAACLLEDGKIVAAAQEERFTRLRHDPGFPTNAVRYCLAEGRTPGGPIDAVVFYDKPVLKFHRILETYCSVAPAGLAPFMKAMPIWIKNKLWTTPRIHEGLKSAGVIPPKKVMFCEHHESHAASAFYPSPFEDAAVLTIDGVGEWSTTTIGMGEGSRLAILEEIRFPHSIGLLYSAFTGFAGFRVNSGEYKLMGLAPYGQPTFVDTILRELVELHDDGSFQLNLRYFGFLTGTRMTNAAFERLFGGPPREPESPITQREMDLARSIQEVTEQLVLRLARRARELTGRRNLCLAGGVALNCVANGRILRERIFEDIWIQPAAGDAGGALGAALAWWHNGLGHPRQVMLPDAMNGALLGPEFPDSEICPFLEHHGYRYAALEAEEWAPRIAELLDAGLVVGLFQGRMEFGPRALGCRSILGDARRPEMQSIMNLKIKFRESFRPFAPACLEEHRTKYFDLDRPSPYMLLVSAVNECQLRAVESLESDDLVQRVNQVRSDLPAITHVDKSARVQTVDPVRFPRFHRLLKAFETLTGCGVLINTSLNVRGEPVVCTPEEAYRCFMRTGMDALVLGSQLLLKQEQPPWVEAAGFERDFALD